MSLNDQTQSVIVISLRFLLRTNQHWSQPPCLYAVVPSSLSHTRNIIDPTMFGPTIRATEIFPADFFPSLGAFPAIDSLTGPIRAAETKHDCTERKRQWRWRQQRC
jgi:hypothetical protein